jgi:hypothetical protein
LLAVFLHKIMNTEISIQMSSIQIISFENELRNDTSAYYSAYPTTHEAAVTIHRLL